MFGSGLRSRRRPHSTGVTCSCCVDAHTYFVSQLAVWGVVFFLPSIVESFGFSDSLVIGAISGLPSIGALIGVLIYPRLFRQYGRPILFVVAALILGAIAGFVGAHAGPVAALAAFALLQSVAVGIGPILWSIAMGTMHGRTSAAGLAMINSIGLLGGFFGPTTFGLVETASGEARGAGVVVSYTFLAALLLAVPVLAVLLGKVTRNVTTQTTTTLTVVRAD